MATSTDHPMSAQRYFISVFALKFTTQFVTALLELPMVRLFEAAACREHYQDRAIPWASRTTSGGGEMQCKIPPIQNKVALLIGLKVTFDAIPGLLTSIWYGAVANTRGRRPVLALACIGQILAWSWVCAICFYGHQFMIETAWLSSAFLLIGGGPRLLLAILFTTCADVITWDKRSVVLFYLHAMTHLSRMLAQPLAAILMDEHLWIPFALALGLLLSELFWIWNLPETLPAELSENQDVNCTDTQSSTTISTTSTLQNVMTMLSHRGLSIIFAAFIVKRIAFSSEGFTFQYASETLHKKLSDTAWLRISNTIGASVVLSIILPLASYFTKWHSPGKDLFNARGSLAIGVIGFGSIFFARTFDAMCGGMYFQLATVSQLISTIGMFIAGLAEGLEPSLQALGAFIVGETLGANFFSFVSMLDVVGEIVAGPSMTAIYRVRDVVGNPAGYAFLLSSALFAGILCASCFMQTRKVQIEAPSNGAERRPLLGDEDE
ncbi:major facilitator superfamily domain-containing protein [Clohesyomyces aquaticus]|uniref:Major facilitator superfamily domain-containing protein n=1 Tax=Clohesyomyces aquaticus TaxID=1231657 RepID=A0A1Y1YLM7_9PLEO|nr:major facilitator superfamily domain-containing protein [Clohesyomyces aquaticus]